VTPDPPGQQRAPVPPPAEAAGAPSGAAPDCAGFHTARDARNVRHLNRWILGAGLVYLGATAAVRWRHAVPAALPWLLTGLAALLALQAVRSYVRFLRGTDELLRRIQLEALALAFGAGALFSILYPLLEGLGAPPLGGHASAAVMMLAWSAGSWLGRRHYSGRGEP
jgi:hypothetical protein